MKAPKKPKKPDALEIRPLPFRDVEEKDLPLETPNKELKLLIGKVFDKAPNIIKSYLKLSAANPIASDKGYINAIGCRNIFPDGPHIDFVPQVNDYTGKIELWMENITQGDSFVISFRVLCGFDGEWEIRSSETVPHYVPITPGYQTIDFLLPPVNKDFGLALIILEPQFDHHGSWVFKDVTVRKVSFD